MHDLKGKLRTLGCSHVSVIRSKSQLLGCCIFSSLYEKSQLLIYDTRGTNKNHWGFSVPVRPVKESALRDWFPFNSLRTPAVLSFPLWEFLSSVPGWVKTFPVDMHIC